MSYRWRAVTILVNYKLYMSCQLATIKMQFGGINNEKINFNDIFID